MTVRKESKDPGLVSACVCLQPTPSDEVIFYTHSFALKVCSWLIVVHIFTTPAAKSSKPHYFWRGFRVESTLLLDREVKRRHVQISTSDLVWPCATSLDK